MKYLTPISQSLVTSAATGKWILQKRDNWNVRSLRECDQNLLKP